jgi:MYXO-CTERM domain-containing protein
MARSASSVSWCGVVAAGLCVITTTASAQFDVGMHGFRFENYTNDTRPVNLTAAELHRMFGDVVCASGTGASCQLTPQAQQWLEQTSESMNGGHCEGMAVLSLRLFLEMDDAARYGGPNAFALSLEGNELLQREIGYWFALQGVAPVSNAETRVAPAQIVELLYASFYEDGPVYTLGFYKRGFREGHAVTPYDIVEEGDGYAFILVYDNNYPSQERWIEVDLENNTWRYDASTSPEVPSSAYEGDATSLTLGVTRMDVRTGPLTCPFCGSYQSGRSASRTVSVTGDASLLIQNEAGQQLGHTSETDFVNDIAGAGFVPHRSADLWEDQAEPTYTVPGGGPLEVFIDDRGDDPAPSDFGVVGPGYYIGVENITLEPGQSDYAYIGDDAAIIAYETSGRETPDIVLAAQTDSADWLVVVRSRGDANGQAIDAEISFEEGGRLDLTFGGADAESEMDLFISRIDAGSTLEFAHENVVVSNGAFLRVPFGAFDADGESLSLDVDADADGTYEESLSLSDTGGTPVDPPEGPGERGGCSAASGSPASSGVLVVIVVAALALRSRRGRRDR